MRLRWSAIRDVLAGAVALQFLVAAVAAPSIAGESPSAISPKALAEIQALLADKATRTEDESKIDSNLLYAMRAVQQTSAGTLQLKPSFVDAFLREHVAADNTVLVSIQASVNSGLLAALAYVGAQDVKAHAAYDVIVARLPIVTLLSIAARTDVRFIGLFDPGASGRYVPSPEELRNRLASLPALIPKIGAATSQGVVAHAADKAQNTGITGTGIKVCVLSDGVDSLAARVTSGDLPAGVDVVAGQAGSGDEGTAMLEIVHDMAPGATLGFATAKGTQAQMATNIQTLRNAPHNCNIIVDDYTYFLEPPFQEGVIAQAVTTVTAGGALYFSDAANSGNFAHAQSGTWEGDYVDGGATGAPLEAGHLHSFGANTYNTITAASGFGWYVLSWSDPMGASGNDYDLFILNSTLTAVLAQSTNRQTGAIDPQEAISTGTNFTGAKIVVVNYNNAAATRALRIDTERGRLAVGTNGNTFGHNGGVNTITTAAVDVATAGGGVFVGGATNPVENFSSDGPRRLFYTPGGVAITPGNFLFGTNGGTLLNKVDITATDGVTTTTPGFIPFFGTSAAAPHAGAIAALAWSANSTATPATIKSALFASALDIEAAGWDVTSGYGIVMADASVRGVLTQIAVTKSYVTPILLGSNSTLTITLHNSNGVDLKNVAFTNTYPSPVVNAAIPNAGISGAGCIGTLGATAGGGSLSLSGGTVPAGVTCTITVTVTSGTRGVFSDNSGNVTTPIGLNTSGASATLTVTGFLVTYNGNVNTSGSAPVDGATYASGATVTVLGNTGSLLKTDFAFAGWNTLANGSGTTYAPTATFTITSNVTLYAKWVRVSYTAPSATGTGNITASITGGGVGCGFTAQQFIPLTGDPASPPPGSAPEFVIFMQGLFHFTVAGCTPGSTVNFTITYPEALPATAQYWKYGPTSSNTTPHWYVLPAVISGNIITFSITDGLLGDDDLDATNGSITDASGPGALTVPIPALNEWMLALLALLLLGFGAQRVRKRR